MYVGVDSTATTVIRQYSTKSDYTLWKFIETTSGNYKLICKATESSGNVLATASKTSGDGSNLTMTTYTDDDNYRDEWNPQIYVVFDNMKIYKGESSVFAPHALKDAVDDTPTAFTYTVVSGTDIVSIDNSTATITAHNLGTALIRVTNIAGSHLYFKVCVPKRAIIIVPGIMGSELISRTDETKFYWDETILNSQSVTETIGILNNLLCDLDGNSINDIVPYNNKYGFMDEYKQLHVDLKNNLGDKYEIDFFAYDWRLSNAISGERLNEFIEKNNFEKVVLVCHSMGGLVASSYLAMGEKQRGKVDTMVSLGTPYLGTPVMIQVWKSADIKMLVPTVDNIGADIMEFLAPVYNHLSTIVWNYRSIYELFPSQKYYDYIYEDYPYITDTLPLNDPLTLLPMNGPELLLNEYGATKAVLLRELPLYRLDMANAADAFHNSLYINEDHVTAYVNTYYFAASYDNSNDQTDNTTYKIQFLNVGDYAVSKTVHGDQMVPVWSADIVNKYPNRTFYKSGIIHGDLVHDSKTFEFIKNLILHDLTIPPESGITTTGGW